MRDTQANGEITRPMVRESISGQLAIDMKGIGWISLSTAMELTTSPMETNIQGNIAMESLGAKGAITGLQELYTTVTFKKATNRAKADGKRSK